MWPRFSGLASKKVLGLDSKKVGKKEQATATVQQSKSCDPLNSMNQ